MLNSSLFFSIIHQNYEYFYPPSIDLDYIVLIYKGCAGVEKDLSVLQRTWYYDQYAEYEFDGKGNGCMCIDKTNHYEFTYDIDGDTLKVDYALDYVTDCEYTYTVEQDKLTLVGGNGTAEPGKVYELTKQE